MCLIFKLLFKIVKRLRGDPGESGANQEVLYYSDVRAVFGVLRRPRYFLQKYLMNMSSANTPKIRVLFLNYFYKQTKKVKRLSWRAF